MVERECRDLREGFSRSSVGCKSANRDETTPYQQGGDGYCVGGGGGGAAAGRRKTYRDVRTKLGIRDIFAGDLKEHLPGRLASPFSESLMDACTFQRSIRNHMVDVSKN
jgi:hypothetical protein